MTCGHCTLEVRGEHGHPQLARYFHWGLRPDGQPHLALYVCTACGALWGRGRAGSGFRWLPKGEVACGDWRRCVDDCRAAAQPADAGAPCDPQCMCELRWMSATPGIASRARLFGPGGAGP